MACIASVAMLAAFERNALRDVIAMDGGEGENRTRAAVRDRGPPGSSRAPYRLGHLSVSSSMVAPAGFEPAPERILRPLPLPIGRRRRVNRGAESGTRTRTGQALNLLPLPLGYLGWCCATDSNREPLASEASASAKLGQRGGLVGTEGIEPSRPKLLIYSQARVHSGLRPRFKEHGGGWRDRTPTEDRSAPRFSRPLAAHRSGILPESGTALLGLHREGPL